VSVVSATVGADAGNRAARSCAAITPSTWPDCGERHHGRAPLTVSFLFLRMSHPKMTKIPSQWSASPSGPTASRAYHAQEKTSLPGPQLAEFYFELVIPLLRMVGVDPHYPFPTCVG
jgi:hypothetical protein